MKKLLNKSEFSYSVSTITGYTDESSRELVVEAVLGAPSIQYLTPRTGIKGTQAVQVLDTSSAIVDGSCGWTASGTTTFTQVDLTVCDKQLQEALCPKDLYSTYQSMMLASGKPEEDVPFLDMIAANKVNEIQKHIESKIWGATVAGGDCFDGLTTKIVSGATGVAVSSGSAFSGSTAYGSDGNPITEVDKLINALSDDAMALDDLTVFMSHANFRLYVQALTKANFFQNYIGDTNITGNVSAIHPNTNIKVVPTVGLNGTDTVMIFPKRYVFFGTDDYTDSEGLQVWWSKDNNELRMQASFSYGVAVKTWSDYNYFAVNGLS